MARPRDNLGDKLGPRLVQLVAQATVATRRGLAPHEAAVGQAAAQGIIDRMGREIAALYGPLIEAALANEDLHPLAADILARAGSGKHQWQAVAGFAFGASGVPGALATIMSNYLAPVVHQLVAADPQMSMDPASAARSVAIGTTGEANGLLALRQAGFDTAIGQTYITLAQAWPSIGVTLDMANRGLITEAEARTYLKRAALPDHTIDAVLNTRHALISPADAALAVLRGNITTAEGEHLAALAGVSVADFRILTLNTGEPPAAQELNEALRRGFITPAEYDKGIRESRIRNEWIPTMLKLRYAPMSTADAINAAVQGHLTIPAARAKTEQNGLEPSDFDAMYQTAGEPLSRTEIEQLYNRGLVDLATVHTALRESHLKDKYIPDATALHVRLAPERSIVMMLQHNAITKPEAAHMLAELGYAPNVAAAFIAQGVNSRVAGSHSITVAEVNKLYADKLVAPAHAREMLTHLGFDTADIDTLFALWDYQAGAALTRQAVAAVRAKYVPGLIDQPAAIARLDAIGVPAEGRDHYLRTWDIERGLVIRTLTEAQVIAAYRARLLPPEEIHARLERLGYNADDANLLMGYPPGAQVGDFGGYTPPAAAG